MPHGPFVAAEVDVVVVGGGHAGVEAALAAARLDCDVVLVTLRVDDIARLACNPAIGGVGKGQLVREIDALGGAMARAADATALQGKMLNGKKGPAVQSPRAQVDKNEYMRFIRRELDAAPRVNLLQGQVVDFLTTDGGDGRSRVIGVVTAEGLALRARAVVVCAGTFMRAKLHLGRVEWPGGRFGEEAANRISDALERVGVRLRRLRTDTPPRIRGRELDFAALDKEPGDDPAPVFSFAPRPPVDPPLMCYGTWTNAASHEAVRRAAADAPSVTGRITGDPPRYCPNIETKVTRFPEVERHHIFIEPETREADEWYMNGFSTSIPPEAQTALVRSLPGCARAQIVRYGYAVEYDAVAPGLLTDTFAVKTVEGLFMAGQVNGTSGYEEAAAQGLFAGANAALSVRGRPPWRVGRHEAYLGVLVDDLVTREQNEPYRLFTSRAEHRLVLRQDNADLRLTPTAAALGLVDRARAEAVESLRGEVDKARHYLETMQVRGPEGERARQQGAGLTLADWLRRPATAWSDVAVLDATVASFPPRVAEQAHIDIRYAGYVARQAGERRKFERAAHERIPADFDYATVEGLSREAREKWTCHRPETIAQAARLGGVRPSDAALLALYLRR